MRGDVVELGAEVSRQDVSLHLLVKNGASVVRRLLDCVGPYVGEVVAVLDDCTDDTEGVLERASRDHDLDLVVTDFSPWSFPHLYLRDLPETYEVGKPLCGEVVPWPFTGEFFLADFAGARNLGWGLAKRKWRLFLDADDVVDDPSSILKLCAALDARGIVAAATPYCAEGRTPGMRERLCRNVPEICWEGRVHEKWVGYDPAKIATVADCLVVRDLGDSTGEGTRVANRNLKILYHRARSRGWDVSPRESYYLALEALRFRGMDNLSARMAEDAAVRSRHAEERAAACVVRGRVADRSGDNLLAALWYSRSLGARYGADAASRLVESLYLLGRHAEAVDAFRLARLLAGEVNVLGGEVTGGAVAAAARSLDFLGKTSEAVAVVREALGCDPTNQDLVSLLGELSPSERKE